MVQSNHFEAATLSKRPPNGNMGKTFKKVLQAKETRLPATHQEEGGEATPDFFTIEEVYRVIISTKDKKTCRPDGLYNEHLKCIAHFLKKGLDTNV